MNVYEIIKQRRSIRKFKQLPVERKQLIRYVEAASLAPQGANMQPVKYLIIDEPDLLEPVFHTTRWAGYLTDGSGTPGKEESPVAYILIVADTRIKKTGYDTDAGAAVENMILAAWDEGIGSCWLGALDRKKLKEIFGLEDHLVIHSMVAFGYPAERPVMMEAEGDIKYYKDEDGVLHVPKRKLEEVLIHYHQK